MRVLLTGAFGNVGKNTLPYLLKKSHVVRCFDIDTKQNRHTKKRLLKFGDFETCWGDIREFEDVRKAVENIDCIIHLAAIIPPMSERNPEFTWAVNVDGTTNLIMAAKEYSPKIIFASSIATYGHCTGEGLPKTANDPQVAIDTYSKTKIEAERRVRESGLPWTIVRLGATVATDMKWISRGMTSEIFDIPLRQRIEFTHPKDVGLALANAVTAHTEGKILLLGGGEKCRMTYGEFMGRIFEGIGIGMLPENAFRVPKCKEDYFHTDWMNTTEAQALLQYQTRTLDDYIEDLKKQIGFKRHLIPLVRWVIRKKLLAKSPYYSKM